MFLESSTVADDGGDQIGRVGFVRRLSAGRFKGLDRLEFGDAVEKYALQFSHRFGVFVGLHALFDLQEG